MVMIDRVQTQQPFLPVANQPQSNQSFSGLQYQKSLSSDTVSFTGINPKIAKTGMLAGAFAFLLTLGAAIMPNKAEAHQIIDQNGYSLLHEHRGGSSVGISVDRSGNVSVYAQSNNSRIDGNYQEYRFDGNGIFTPIKRIFDMNNNYLGFVQTGPAVVNIKPQIQEFYYQQHFPKHPPRHHHGRGSYPTTNPELRQLFRCVDEITNRLNNGDTIVIPGNCR